MPLSADFNAICQDYFFRRTTLARADVAIVYGNRLIVPELARAVLDHYAQGLFSTVIVTGGVETPNGASEARAVASLLRRGGIPMRSVLIDEESFNTSENLQNARDLLHDHVGMHRVQSLIGFGHASAGPRFIMTAGKIMPHVVPMHVCVYPDDVQPHRWDQHDHFREKAQRDAEKIPAYLALNYLVPLTVDQVNQQVSNLRSVSHALASNPLSRVQEHHDFAPA